MKTLEEAWGWYNAVREGMGQLARLARYWSDLPWDGDDEWVDSMKRDKLLRHVEAEQMAANPKRVLAELDDLAVLVLFSVFEAIVREQLQAEVQQEVAKLKHATLIKAGRDVLENIAVGSFFRVLEPFKPHATTDLVERVNKVRRYRNWVAHGRRGDKREDKVDEVYPKDAYDWLREFLGVVSPPAPVGGP